MKTLLLLLPVILLPACSNTTIVVHKTALDINAEFSSDLAKPVSANIGYESHAAIAVPPRISQGFRTLRDRKILPKGDVLSTITSVKVEPVIVSSDPTAPNPAERYALDFVASAATGRAADVASGATAASIADTAEKSDLKGSKSFQESASGINNDRASIPDAKRVSER